MDENLTEEEFRTALLRALWAIKDALKDLAQVIEEN